MTAIAMTQEMGSLGKDVALGVAQALGLTQVRDEISEEVAQQRVQWLMERLDADQQFAEEEIRRSDAARAANIRRWFDKPFGDPLDYDLVLNTGRVSVEGAVETIKLVARRPEFQPNEASRARLARLALEASVHAALRTDPATAELRIVVEFDEHEVTLSGIVVDESERAAGERVVAKVPGVREVVNNLKIMKGHKLFRQ